MARDSREDWRADPTPLASEEMGPAHPSGVRQPTIKLEPPGCRRAWWKGVKGDLVGEARPSRRRHRALLRSALVVLLAGPAAGCGEPGRPAALPVDLESSGQASALDAGSRSVAVLDHPAPVTTVTFAPGGRRVVTGDRRGELRLWDLGSADATGSLRAQRLGRLPYEVHQVAWLPAGDRLVVEGLDSTLRLWDTTDGRRLRTLEEHAPPPLFALSREGSKVASVARREIRVHDTTTGRVLQRMPAHEHFTLSLAFGGGGRLLASGGDRGVVRLREVASGETQLELAHPEPSVQQLALSEDGLTLVTWGRGKGAAEAPLRIWDGRSGAARDELRAPDGSWRRFALSADGRWLVGADDRGRVHLWQLPHATPVETIEADGRAALTLLQEPETSDLLLAASADQRVELLRWKPRALASRASRAAPHAAPPPIAVEPDPDGVVRVSDAPELLGSIAPDRTVVLAPGTYDLSSVRYRDLPHVSWRRVPGGEELVVHGVSGLTLRGDPGGTSRLVVSVPAAAVLAFEDVRDLRLEHLVLRHDVEDACSGPVLAIRASRKVALSDVELLGSGSDGLRLDEVRGFSLQGSAVRECTSSLVTARRSHDLRFADSRLGHSGSGLGAAFVFEESTGVQFHGVRVENNRAGAALFSVKDGEAVVVRRATLSNNAASALADPRDGVRLVESQVRANDFPPPLPESSPFAGIEVAHGAVFARGGGLQVENSLFRGCASDRVAVGDPADLVDARGLLCPVRIAQVEGDGCLLEPLDERCAAEGERTIPVFLLHPAARSRQRAAKAAVFDAEVAMAGLPEDVRSRVEQSQRPAGVEHAGDVDGDGSVDLLSVSYDCRSGSEYTCGSIVGREEGRWVEIERWQPL